MLCSMVSETMPQRGSNGTSCASNVRLASVISLGPRKPHPFLEMQVLENRAGIPITLALVYMEVAARVGFGMVGLNMPGAHPDAAACPPGCMSSTPSPSLLALRYGRLDPVHVHAQVTS